MTLSAGTAEKMEWEKKRVKVAELTDWLPDRPTDDDAVV